MTTTTTDSPQSIPARPRRAPHREPGISLIELIKGFYSLAFDQTLDETIRKLYARLSVLSRHVHVNAERQEVLAQKQEAMSVAFGRRIKHLESQFVEMIALINSATSGAETGGTPEAGNGLATSSGANADGDAAESAASNQRALRAAEEDARVEALARGSAPAEGLAARAKPAPASENATLFPLRQAAGTAGPRRPGLGGGTGGAS